MFIDFLSPIQWQARILSYPSVRPSVRSAVGLKNFDRNAAQTRERDKYGLKKLFFPFKREEPIDDKSVIYIWIDISID